MNGMKPVKLKSVFTTDYCSAREASSYLSTPHIWISIGNSDSDTFEPWLSENENRKAHLHVNFYDTDARLMQGGFHPRQAKQIIDFVVEHTDENTVVMVNCMAGVSRSAGVAAALTKLACQSDNEFFKQSTPNMLVYRTMLEVGMKMLDETTL